MPKTILTFDIEANNLLLDVTKIHCLVVQNVDTGEVFRFRHNSKENTLMDGWRLLASAHRIVAHNGIDYDIPAMVKVLGTDAKELPPCIDTILISRLLYPDRKSCPVGEHGLQDWGKYLKLHKMEQPQDWSEWTQQMEDYCVGDVLLTTKVYKFLLPRAKRFRRAVKLEHEVAPIINRQFINGFGFDEQEAMKLVAKLQIEKAEVHDKLCEAFPPLVEEMKTPEYWVGVHPETGEVVKCPTKSQAAKVRPKLLDIRPGPLKKKYIPFNPGSRQQFADRMKERYKWKPKAFTEKGNAIIDETVLATIEYPEARLMERYLLVEKRLSQVQGQWLKMVRHGRIHGSVITNGCVSGRMAHFSPNVAQVPKVGSPFGEECRSCWIPRPGWLQVGADASGLELRMLAHEMAAFDGGAYVKVLLEGDIHTVNQEAAGIDTRDNAKTFIYAFLYGAGDSRIGKIVGGNSNTGKKLKAKFLKNLPALGQVKRMVDFAARSKGYLIGLDGRPLPVRSPHMALNTLLQSNGAVVMKQALVLLDQKLQEQFTPGIDYEFMANIHDEWQIECRPEIAETVGKTAVKAIEEAGRVLGVRCPLTGEYKIGNNWKETH